VHKSFLLLVPLLVTLPADAQTAETPQSPDKVQTTPVYTQSKEGFRSQLDTIVRQYRAGDTTTGRHAIDQFHLPHSEEWFSEHLGPEQSAKLAERYDRLFANFAESLAKTIEDIVANRGADLTTDLEEEKNEKPSSIRPGQKLSGMVTIKETQLFYCHFQVTVKKKNAVSWADTFAHEDGAFRFVGFGGWPFWVWGDGSEGGAPKGGSFSQPAILIAKVPPIYPPSARANRIEGFVVVRLRIDKDGRVAKVDVLNGDPLLAQAAVDAARQWRYKPGTLGGQPVESEVIVNIGFTLP
jgi:TonB family protein